MLISIVIPTKNRPIRLANNLAKLSAQSYSQWEALVIDDGDGLGARAATNINDKRIKGYQNVGCGQVDARNTAITLAKGGIIALLDDDDWWEDVEHLQKVVDVFQTKSVLVHSHGWVIIEEDNLPKEYIPYTLPATAQSLLKNNTLLTSSIVYPKKWHQELGLFDRSVGGYFDWDWYIRVIKAGYDLHTITSLGVCYLQHSQNGSKVVHGERRKRDFTAFQEKHGLELEIKNHMVVLSEINF